MGLAGTVFQVRLLYAVPLPLSITNPFSGVQISTSTTSSPRLQAIGISRLLIVGLPIFYSRIQAL